MPESNTPTLPPLANVVAARIVAGVEARASDLIALTRELIACRTDSQSEENPEFSGEAERCQSRVAELLRSLDVDVAQWTEPPRYPVVAGKLAGSGGGPSLAFNGHVDVVPVGDTGAWRHDPWAGVVAEGRLWGRGAADMKGGVACALMAMRVLRDVGVELSGDLWAHVVCDEEVVGRSTRHLLGRVPEVDAVLVAEPTDLTIMPVEGGLVHFRIEVDGRESHAGNRYMSIHAGGQGASAGINAIEKALCIVTALRDLEGQWGNLRHHPMLPAGFNSIMPGIIVGGPGGGADGRLNLISNPGTAPNYCAVEYNLWFLPGESFDSIRDEIEGFVRMVSATDPWLRDHPPRFTWKLRDIYFPAAETAPDHPFLQSLAGALTLIAAPPTVTAFTAASELAWYAERGIPGTIFGPGRIAQAHGANEYVEMAQLQAACTVMALTAASWCGVAGA